jgi:hypothetical protein
MATRVFALMAGLLYSCAGILAFLPAFDWWPERADPGMYDVYFHGGRLGGFVEENWPHNILWLTVGLGGIFAAATYGSAKLYAQGLFGAMVLLTLLGLMPVGIGDLWGYLPLSGWNIPIHAITAILAWYYGFVHTYDLELRTAP